MSKEISLYYKRHCLFSAFKIGLCTLIGLWLIATFQLPLGYVALLPIVSIPIVYHDSMEKNLLERGVGSFIGSAFGLLLLILNQNWLVFTLIIFCIIAFGLLHASRRNLKYSMIWVMVTLGSIYSLAHSDIQNVAFQTVHFVINLWIGIVIVLLVEYTLFPRYPFKQLKQILAFTPLEKINFNEVDRLLSVSKYRIPKATLVKAEAEVRRLKALSQVPLPLPQKAPAPLSNQELFGTMKVAFTFLTAIALTGLLALPGGFQIVIVVAVSCLQPTLGHLQKKIFDRLIGLLLGLSASIVFVMILGQIPTFWCLTLIYLSWIMGAAYLGISRPEWFYFSVQAAIIVILIIASDTSAILPTTEIMWERTSAIFQGYLISTILMTLFKLKD